MLLALLTNEQLQIIDHDKLLWKCFFVAFLLQDQPWAVSGLLIAVLYPSTFRIIIFSPFCSASPEILGGKFKTYRQTNSLTPNAVFADFFFWLNLRPPYSLCLQGDNNNKNTMQKNEMNKAGKETPWHWTGTKTQFKHKDGSNTNRHIETITISILTGTGGESCHKYNCKNRKKFSNTTLWQINICTKTQTDKR